MKKRVLLIIMILFSIKVNSNDECKLPEITFFEVLSEEGVTKFSFKSLVDTINQKQSTPGGTVKVLGVEFNKNEAIGALARVGEIFKNGLLQNAAAGVEVSIKERGAIDQLLTDLAVELNAYDSAISGEDLEFLQARIVGDSTTQTKGMTDYLMKVVEESKVWGFGWLLGSTKYLVSENTDLLNASLNYAYLLALSYLIRDVQVKSKFLSCMENIVDTDLVKKMEAVQDTTIKFGMLNIFDEITGSMMGKIKPQPLTLEQNREVLGLLSTTLGSLASLKFS